MQPFGFLSFTYITRTQCRRIQFRIAIKHFNWFKSCRLLLKLPYFPIKNFIFFEVCFLFHRPSLFIHATNNVIAITVGPITERPPTPQSCQKLNKRFSQVILSGMCNIIILNNTYTLLFLCRCLSRFLPRALLLLLSSPIRTRVRACGYIHNISSPCQSQGLIGPGLVLLACLLPSFPFHFHFPMLVSFGRCRCRARVLVTPQASVT